MDPDAPEAVDSATPAWDPEEIDAGRDRALVALPPGG